MKFEDRVASLAGSCLCGPPVLAPATLLTTLGCRVMMEDGRRTHLVEGRQPHFSQESLVAATLIKAMHWHREWDSANIQFAGALLDGLARNERWRLCLDSVDDAYYLASLLIKLTYLATPADGPGTDDNEKQLHDLLNPAIRTIACGWLDRPVESAFLSMDELTRALFGDAWCHLVLQDKPMLYMMVTKIILAYLPVFLPGLCPRQDEVLDGLPELECQ
jgi:hypothetical protein